MLTPIESVVGDDEEDTRLLHDMAATARSYLNSFPWRLPITATLFAYGVAGVVAIFLIKFEGKIAGTDDRLWVIVGDLPSAYVVVEPEDSSREALERYCILMDDWINAVLSFGDFGDIFPVEASRTPANAELLRKRLDFIRDEIIPQMPQDFLED